MNRFELLAFLLYALVLLGLATLSGAVLALAVPLAVYLAAGLLYRPSELRLEASRALNPPRTFPGEPITVTVTITNHGPAIEEIIIREILPPRLEIIDGDSALLAALPTGASVELSYTCVGPRGIYDFTAVLVGEGNLLGQLSGQLLLQAPGQLLILPDAPRLQSADVRARHTRVYSGFIPSRQGGAGVEFFGVREHQPGQPTRSINARATARYASRSRPVVFVNEFQQERVADICLILDGRQLSDTYAQGTSLFEHGVSATATLADTFLAQGNRVGLLIYWNAVDWTFPGYGKVQRERIMRALARAQTGSRPHFEGLELIPARLFPARSQIVMVSPLLPNDLDPLVSLRALGYQIVIISPDPITFEQRGLGSRETVQVAGRLARIERDLLLTRLQRNRIQVVDWDVETPFPVVASQALNRRSSSALRAGARR